MTMPEAVSIIGIDIGGTKVCGARIVLDSKSGQARIEASHKLPTPHTREAFLQTLADLVSELNPTGQAVAVGVATAGTVNPLTGEIVGATGNLPAIDSKEKPFPFKALLEERIGLPVRVENDANAAAYGEYKAGAAAGARYVFMITLGTGVGTGIVLDGKIYHGGHYTAGEGGHLCVSLTQTRRCPCGLWDCWEAYASGPALVQTARDVLTENLETAEAKAFLAEQPMDSVTTQQITAAWEAGNVLAREAMTRWHRYIAAGLGGHINLLDPEVIVVGGGMAPFVDFKLLQQDLKNHVMLASFDQMQVLHARLGNEAGMVGAAYLALEMLTQKAPVLHA